MTKLEESLYELRVTVETGLRVLQEIEQIKEDIYTDVREQLREELYEEVAEDYKNNLNLHEIMEDFSFEEIMECYDEYDIKNYIIDNYEVTDWVSLNWYY